MYMHACMHAYSELAVANFSNIYVGHIRYSIRMAGFETGCSVTQQAKLPNRAEYICMFLTSVSKQCSSY